LAIDNDVVFRFSLGDYRDFAQKARYEFAQPEKKTARSGYGEQLLCYRFFFLWRIFRRRFLRLCVAILCRLRFFPLGIGVSSLL
jgi:hypothetical protein